MILTHEQTGTECNSVYVQMVHTKMNLYLRLPIYSLISV